jgi:hypothetical protein
MAKTEIGQVVNQVQKFWAPLAMDALVNKKILSGLCNKEYEGQIKKKGDTVRVSIVDNLVGQTRTIGTDAMSFTPEALSMQHVDVKADKLFIASVEIDDIVDIQSQIDKGETKLLDALTEAVKNQVNKYLYSLVNPILANEIQSNTNLDSAALLDIRKRAAQAKWKKEGGWYGLVDPSYYNDILADQVLASIDYQNEKPSEAGVVANKRYGFQIFEDDGLATDKGLFFHPDFLLFVKQTEMEIKISDKHSSKELGYVMSAHFYGGAKLGPQGDSKHIYVTSEAAGFTPGV